MVLSKEHQPLPLDSDWIRKREAYLLATQDTVRHVTGSTLDSDFHTGPGQLIDAEQGFKVEILSARQVAVEFHVVNPSFYFDASPQGQAYLAQAQQKVATSFENGRIVDPLLPIEFIQALCLHQGQVRPTVAVRFNLDLQTGALTNLDLFQAHFTTQFQIEASTINAILQTNNPYHGFDFEPGILQKIAVALTQRQNPGMSAEGILGRYQYDYPSKRNMAMLIITSLSEAVGEVMAALCLERGYPVLYSNLITPRKRFNGWPQTYLTDVDDSQTLLTDTPEYSELNPSPVQPVPSNSNHLVFSNQLFEDPLCFGNRQYRSNVYLRWTAPIRDVRCLYNILTVDAMLNEQPPPFTRPQQRSIARVVFERAQKKADNRRAIKEQAKIDMIHQAILDSAKLFGNIKQWKLIINYWPRLTPTTRQQILEVLRTAETHIADHAFFQTFRNWQMNFVLRYLEAQAYIVEQTSFPDPEASPETVAHPYWTATTTIINGSQTWQGSSTLRRKKEAETVAMSIAFEAHLRDLNDSLT